MKYIITESQHNKIIDKFITYQFEPHEVKKSSEYPDSIFWVKDGEVIAEIIEKLEYFLADYQIWDTISSMFSLGDIEVQQVIKDWLEGHYKLGGLTLQKGDFVKVKMLEGHYKLGGLTPYKAKIYHERSWKNIKLD